MATRSFIGIQNDDGTVRGIYCHWDGYPEHNGVKLESHYTNSAKIEALLALGDISILGDEIGEKHDFDDTKMHSDWTKAYHRDRGESLNPNKVYPSLEAMRKNAAGDLGVEWAYVWQGNFWTTLDV